jgi:hypothetical protein
MCASTEEWMKKMWYIYSMEYYSATNKHEIMLYAGKMDGIRAHHIKQNKLA